MPEAGTGASIVHQLSQHMQILFCVSRVFSTFLSQYNMCVASRMVMFCESSFPGHWLPLTACRILPTILSFSLLFNLAHCQGNHEDAFGGRIMNFRDVAHDTIYYQYRQSPHPNPHTFTFYFFHVLNQSFFIQQNGKLSTGNSHYLNSAG